MQALNLNDILKILYMYKVRVKNGRLVVSGGDRFPPHVRSAIYTHKPEILKIYSEHLELMDMIDDMERKAKESESKLMEDSADLWQRYFMLCDSLNAQLPKPWVIVPEDKKRCSFCPNLGMTAKDGVICEHECKQPY